MMHKQLKHLYPDDDAAAAAERSVQPASVSRTQNNRFSRKTTTSKFNSFFFSILSVLAFFSLFSSSISAKQSSKNNNNQQSSVYNKYYRSHIAPSLSCDFENNQNSPYCTYEQEQTDDADWSKEIITDENAKSGHNTVLSFSTLTQKVGSVARIHSPKIALQESHCIKFRYKIETKNGLQQKNTDNFNSVLSSAQLSVFIVEDTDWAYQNAIWSTSVPSDEFQEVELSLVPDRYHLVFEARVLSEQSIHKILVDDIRAETRRCTRAPHFLRLGSLEMNRGQSGAFTCKLADHDLSKYLPNESGSMAGSKVQLRLEMAGGGKFIRPDSLPMVLDKKHIDARFSFSEATDQISGKYRCVVKEPRTASISNYASLNVKIPPTPLFAPVVVKKGSTHLVIDLNIHRFRGDYPIISRKLQYHPVNGGDWTDTHPILFDDVSRNTRNLRRSRDVSSSVGVSSGNKTTYKLWNLLPDTAYEFRVLLSRPGIGGEGQPGPSLKTTMKCAIPVKSVTGVEAQALGAERVSLVWDKPSKASVRCTDYSYEVRFRAKNGGKNGVSNGNQQQIHQNNKNTKNTKNTKNLPFRSIKVTNIDQLGVELDQLQPFVQYEIFVDIVNTAGSLESKPIYVKTDEDVPGMIQRSGFKASQSDENTVLLKWSKPKTMNGKLLEYEIGFEGLSSWMEQDIDLGRTETVIVGSESVSQEVQGLYPGTEYRFTIRASTKVGYGPATSITFRTKIGRPTMPVYTNNVKPVISLAPKGQLTLALYPAFSNGAPIEKYMVIVQNTTKNNSMSRLKKKKKRDLSESSKKSLEVCPHVAKYSYGEHQTSGYYVCAEIKQSMFKLDDVVQFKLGNNKTSFKYSNPSLKSGTYDIWYYAVTKKLAGARSQSCVKLASVKVPLKSWSTQKPEIQYLYQSESSNFNDDYNNQIIFPTSKVHSVKKEEETNLTTYLVAIALAFILVVAIVAGYAVFARKNNNTGLQGKLQSKDSSGGYSNGIVNNGVLAQGGFGNFGSSKHGSSKNDEKHHEFSHTYETEPFDSLEKSRMIPGFQDSGYQGQHYDNYKGNGGRIPGQISVTEQSDMFDVKIFASDGRLDHSQHSTPVHLANTTRSQESSPLLFDKQGGYDDSGYPNSLGRGKPDILNNARSPGRSPGRTPTPKNNGQGSNQQISHQISNHQISNQMSSPQIHQVQGGVSTPPVFLSGTLQSNSSSIQTRLNNTSSIRVEDFPIAVNQMKTSNICGFTNDFESISNLEGPFEVANRSENRQKNRNQAVVPFDYSRVKLKGAKYLNNSDYINASMVNGYRNPLAYIATQAPLDATVIDFWEMVWGENSRVIVMLTKLLEQGRNQCAIYWPTHQGTPTLFGNIVVTLERVEHIAHYTIRTFNVKHSQQQQQPSRVIIQFQLTCWPERGVPARATNLLEYMRRVKSVTKESHPTVVHCTTGAGRTGCFIALDMALDMAREEGLIDIKGLVEGLRSRRPHMVESLQQYEWLHDAALEAVLCGDTCVYGMDLTSHYDHLITLDPVCGQAPIVEEFETLVIMTPKLQIAQHCTTALLQKNKQKNRYADVLPADAHLPSLTLDNRWFTTSQNETYINATLCDSYSRPGEIIISQTPQPHTVVDFWRLIWDYGVYSVVMTDDLGEHDESCQIYWPRGSVSANSTHDRNAGNGGNNGGNNKNGNSDHNLLNNSLNDSSASSRSDRSDTPCSSNTNAGEVCVRYGPFEIELLTKDDEIDLAVRTLKITKKLAPINGNHQNGHNSMNNSQNNTQNNSQNNPPQFNQFQSSRDNSINSRHLRNSETRIIKHFQLLAWPPKNAVPTSRNSTLRIISLLQKWRKEVAHSIGQTLSPIDGPEAPAPRTLVHCIAGAGRSGTFSCCYNVVEQIMAEKSADIFSQALKLRSHRPQMIEGLDQYRFVYEVAGTFVDDTFENGDKTL